MELFLHHTTVIAACDVIVFTAMETFIFSCVGRTIFGFMAFYAAFTTDWIIFAATESANMAKTLTCITFDDTRLVYKLFSYVSSVAEVEFVSYD